MGTFEKVKAIAKVQSSPYHYVKTWFENQFPHYNEQVEFDEDGAEWTTDESWEESGYFTLGAGGELTWHDDNLRVAEDSVFVR